VANLPADLAIRHLETNHGRGVVTAIQNDAMLDCTGKFSKAGKKVVLRALKKTYEQKPAEKVGQLIRRIALRKTWTGESRKNVWQQSQNHSPPPPPPPPAPIMPT
jgi:hypothetical protein